MKIESCKKILMMIYSLGIVTLAGGLVVTAETFSDN